MRKIFSTEQIQIQSKFRAWSEVTYERFVPTEREKPVDEVFNATLNGVDIGRLFIILLEYDRHNLKTTPNTIRRHDKKDFLTVNMVLSGTVHCSQHGRAARQRTGDLTVFDNNAPLVLEYPDTGSTLLVELPRERLEDLLGGARLFSTLNVDAHLTTGSVARTFFRELIRVRERLNPLIAERMTSIGVDLLVASIAERMARRTPESLQGVVLLQRAKIYVEANFGDPDLDPRRLAAAMGVPLRRLQDLFHQQGQQISDWIWHRRLEAAAKQLADPGYAHLPIGMLAYGCGFVNQAHFSRRFRERFGASPADYRRAELAPA